MAELKVTGLTKLPSTYKGEPCIMTIEIEDVEGSIYESEIHMDEGYNPNTLRDAVVESFKMCDAQAKSVNVKSFRIKHKTNGE